MMKQAVRTLATFLTSTNEADEEQRTKAIKNVEARIKRTENADMLEALQTARHNLQYCPVSTPKTLPEESAAFFFSYLQCTGRKTDRMKLHRDLLNLTEYIRRDRDEAEAIFWDTLWTLACEIEADVKKGGTKHLTYKAYRPASQVGRTFTHETWDGVTYPVAVLTGRQRTNEDEGFEGLEEPLVQVEYTHRALGEAWTDKTWMNRTQDKLIKRFARAFIAWEQQGTTWRASETVSRLSLEEQAEAGRMDFILSQAGTTRPQVEADATSLIAWVSDALPEYLRESLTKALASDKPMPERDRKRVIKHLTAHDITLEALQQALSA